MATETPSAVVTSPDLDASSEPLVDVGRSATGAPSQSPAVATPTPGAGGSFAVRAPVGEGAPVELDGGPRLGMPATRLGRATEVWLELGLAGLLLLTVLVLALR